MQIVVDGLLANYQRSGEGKAVIILHGWGDSGKSWQTLAGELSKQYQVIVPDLPGFGGTQAPTSPWGLDDYAKFIEAFLKKLDIKDLYAIIGHSNGGAIAIRGLVANHFTADELILLSSAGIRGEYKGRNKALRYITKTGKVLTSPLPRSAKRKLRQQVYKTVGSDMLVAEHLQETFKKVVSDDVRGDASKIDVPTLIIYGEGDTQAPVRYGETFHELIDNSTLEVLPGAGHFVQLDRPDEVAHAIKEFLV